MEGGLTVRTGWSRGQPDVVRGGPVLWEGGVGRAAGLWVGLSGGVSGHSEGFLQGHDLIPAKLQQHCSGLRTRAGLRAGGGQEETDENGQARKWGEFWTHLEGRINNG